MNKKYSLFILLSFLLAAPFVSAEYLLYDDAETGTAKNNGWFARSGTCSTLEYSTDQASSGSKSLKVSGGAGAHCAIDIHRTLNGTTTEFDFYDNGGTYHYAGLGDGAAVTTAMCFRNTGLYASNYGCGTGGAGDSNQSGTALSVGWKSVKIYVAPDNSYVELWLEGSLVRNDTSEALGTIGTYFETYQVSTETNYIDNIRVYVGKTEPDYEPLKYRLEAYYSFDNTNISGATVYDLLYNYDGTNSGATSGATGILGEAFDFELSDGTDHISMGDQSTFTFTDAGRDQPFSFSFWLNQESQAANQIPLAKFLAGGGATEYQPLIYANGSIQIGLYTTTPSTHYTTAQTITAINTSDWTHIVYTYNGTELNTGIKIYIDGVAQTLQYGGAGSYTGMVDTTATFTVGSRDQLCCPVPFDGLIDELAIYSRVLNASEISQLYNSGAGLSYYSFTGGGTPAAPTASERLQQDSSIEQNATVTVNSASYVPIMSSSITIPDDTWLYGSATIPISPTTSNTATCRLTIDGAELNETETNRTLTAGSAGNMLITSLNHYVTAGAHNFGLECKRAAGGGYTVGNASIILHILTTPGGVPLVNEQLNFSTATLPGLLGSTTITTSDNNTATGLNRYLVAEWAANYAYGATGNISVVTELAGTNCTEVKRYGASGATGSVGGVCYVDVGNVTNGTTYDFKVWGTGTGSVTNAKFHIKEFILHEGEINSTSLNGLSGNGNIANINLTVSGGHSNPDLIGQAVLSVTASPTTTGTFYLTADAQNSTYVSRSSAAGQPGVLGVHKDFLTVSGTVALTLVGNCAACTLTGQNLVGYITSDLPATPNEFVVSANSVYGGSISVFSINLSDGRTFSTSTGSISVPATGELLNISAVENSGAAIPYFANYTAAVNHNSTVDITLNLTPYTIINATYAGAKVNNFTVNGTTTTTGAVYVRLYDTTSEFTISDAVSAGGTNLSDQTQNVTASPYLQNYTFIMLTANAFNFSIIDEITETAITQNMTVEIISGASAGTYTTTDGTLYLELLTPSDYTIRYYSTLNTNYTQRDYIQTLVDRQRYEINLYGLENDEATDMVVTVKDTSGDPVEGAIVKLLRYFTSCNCYNVVEMSTTSAAGESYFIVDAYDGHYKFTVEYNGETEFISSSPENFVPSGGLVSRTITINLGSAYFQSFRALTNVARTLVYNNATKGLSFTWNDPSGIVSKGCLYAEYLDGVHYTPVTPVCQEASTGSVVLTLNNSANSFKYYAELETSTTYSEYVVFSGVIDKIRETLLQGNVGLGAFLGAGLIIVMALMFSFSAIAVVVITAIGVVGMSVLGIASLSTVFITGFATLILGLAAYLMRS